MDFSGKTPPPCGANAGSTSPGDRVPLNTTRKFTQAHVFSGEQSTRRTPLAGNTAHLRENIQMPGGSQ